MLPVTDAGLWYRRILAQGCYQLSRIMFSPLGEHIADSGKPLRQCCPQFQDAKFRDGLVVGSQFTQKTNAFPVNWDPTTNPSWNFVPLKLQAARRFDPNQHSHANSYSGPPAREIRAWSPAALPDPGNFLKTARLRNQQERMHQKAHRSHFEAPAVVEHFRLIV